MMCVLCCGVEPSTKNEIVRNFLPPPYKKKCVNIMKQTKNGSYEKIMQFGGKIKNKQKW